MPQRGTLAGLVAAAALIVAGCADDADDAGEAEGTATSDDTAGTDGGGSDPPEGSADSSAGGSAEAPESGVAAQVGSSEIPVTTVNDVYDDLSSLPQLEEQLQGEGGEQLQGTLRSQILTQLVVQEIIVQAAEDDYGIEVTSADRDSVMDDLTNEAGGEAELDEQLEGAGYTRDAFVTMELPTRAAIQGLESEFGVESPATQGEEPSAEQQELQAWASEKFQQADVSVADDYGAWNAETGQIDPAA